MPLRDYEANMNIIMKGVTKELVGELVLWEQMTMISLQVEGRPARNAVCVRRKATKSNIVQE